MASLFRAAFPSATLVDTAGNLTPAWRGFFQSLYARTGGSNGVSSDTTQLEAELEAERQARIAADQGLAAGLVAERTARQQADSSAAEALYGETVARKAADALLVPKAELCGLWAGCNLAFLPTADPGGGKPWNDGGHLAVGTPAVAVVGVGLEDGTGRWGLQDGTGAWLWG
jgi:hypothetical protein